MSELEILMAMTSEERSLHFNTQVLEMEESELKSMIRSVREPEFDTYYEYLDKAKGCVEDYQEDGDEQHLADAEFYTEVAKSLKLDRSTIKEIRQQRERIQWVKKTRVTKPTTEPSPSSELSTS